jgi:hypothetical protein
MRGSLVVEVQVVLFGLFFRVATVFGGQAPIRYRYSDTLVYD